MKKNKALAVPFVLWAVLFIAVPLAMVVWYGVTVEETPAYVEVAGDNGQTLFQLEDGTVTAERPQKRTVISLANFRRMLEPTYLKLLLRSLKIALFTTIICLLLGYPAALIMADREIKLGKKQSGDKFVAKCAALGINEIPSASASDSDKATRQDVAVILYKSLRYIENQGIYAYTEFDNGLDKYIDKKDISPAAEEAMSFMEALGLIKGKTATTICPKEICSIEQAIDVAEKCTHAHQLGWYQERAWGEGIGRNVSGNVYTGPDEGYSTFQTYAPGERVWVTGPRIGGMWEFLPIVDRYTGKTVYVKAEWYTPVRKHVFTSKKTVKTIEFKDYWDGTYMWTN